MEGGGFEPPKAELADLQSAPFGHSGTPPDTPASGSWRWDSNPQPPDYKSGALPIELRQPFRRPGRPRPSASDAAPEPQCSGQSLIGEPLTVVKKKLSQIRRTARGRARDQPDPARSPGPAPGRSQPPPWETLAGRWRRWRRRRTCRSRRLRAPGGAETSIGPKSGAGVRGGRRIHPEGGCCRTATQRQRP